MAGSAQTNPKMNFGLMESHAFSLTAMIVAVSWWVYTTYIYPHRETYCSHIISRSHETETTLDFNSQSTTG